MNIQININHTALKDQILILTFPLAIVEFGTFSRRCAQYVIQSWYILQNEVRVIPDAL